MLFAFHRERPIQKQELSGLSSLIEKIHRIKGKYGSQTKIVVYAVHILLIVNPPSRIHVQRLNLDMKTFVSNHNFKRPTDRILSPKGTKARRSSITSSGGEDPTIRRREDQN